MRRQITLQPYTYTERLNVEAAGMSVKVARITLGDRCSCLGLVASSGVAMGTQQSAEAILRWPTTTAGPHLKGRDSDVNGESFRGVEVDTAMGRAHT